MRGSSASGERTAPAPTLPPLHESWLPSAHALYRPRHSPRQRTALVAAALFFGLPLLLMLLGVRASEIENRKLAEFPAPAEGWQFFAGVDRWATDHLPIRGAALDAVSAVSRGVFGEPPAFARPAAGPAAPSGPVAPPVSAAEDKEKVRKAAFPRVIEGRDGWLYLGYDVQGACLPDRPAADVIAALRRLRSAVEASGRKFVLVVPPNKTTMVPQHLPETYVGQACARQAREAFWSTVAPAAGAIDLRGVLSKAAVRAGAPLYSGVDTHWTREGALHMTRAVAEAVQPGVASSWRSMPAGWDTHAGDLPPMLGRNGTYQSLNHALAPDGMRVRTRPVAGDFRDRVLRLGQGPGQGVVGAKVGMIADSFSEPAKSFLDAGFADLTVVHADLVGADPRAIGAAFAETDAVVFEVVERSLVGGDNPVLDPTVLAALTAELAAHPR